ncbi:DinB family protein [Cytophagales bacterium LB-30]|uniref:DinB family protein n=1 Tax=Shiella aurantiaca TaxID=3058365 RepID=A0ABT8F1Y9_9BACT|nr:DUF1572 family protein [Shiella aurantiaca]MDN4164460.1 DinB family protein [Shiella aurantiaca]
MESLGAQYLKSSIQQFEQYKKMGDSAINQVPEEMMSWQPGEQSNSLAVIVHHMSGNMRSRWTNFLTEDGEKPWRQRDEEFEEDERSKAEVMAAWESGWKVVFDTLNSLKEEDLSKTINIRAQGLTVVEAINRQLTHYASHVGQMIYLAKLICGENWKTLSIPKGGSDTYNSQLMGKN